jgi:hypothetical protein
LFDAFTPQGHTMSRYRDDTPPTLEQRARRRVALKSGFFIHAAIYLLVNAGLFALGAFNGLQNGWEGGWGPRHGLSLPLWGWGLGLAIHGLVVLVRLQGEGQRQRWVEREIEALKRREGAGS